MSADGASCSSRRGRSVARTPQRSPARARGGRRALQRPRPAADRGELASGSTASTGCSPGSTRSTPPSSPPRRRCASWRATASASTASTSTPPRRRGVIVTTTPGANAARGRRDGRSPLMLALCRPLPQPTARARRRLARRSRAASSRRGPSACSVSGASARASRRWCARSAPPSSRTTRTSIPSRARGGLAPGRTAELLRASTSLSLHAPLTTARAASSTARCSPRLPPRRVLVNTARGELVDEEALPGRSTTARSPAPRSTRCARSRRPRATRSSGATSARDPACGAPHRRGDRGDGPRCRRRPARRAGRPRPAPPSRSPRCLTSLDGLRRARVVAVLRADSADAAVRSADALVAAGVRAIELTFTTPDAADALRSGARRHGDDVLIGAGTIRTVAQVRRAVDAGADFLVTPHLAPRCWIAWSRAARRPSGRVHADRGRDALDAGARWSSSSRPAPAVLRTWALRGPFPELQVIPTGGIGAADVRAWLDAGGAAVGVGGELCPPALVRAARWQEPSGAARRAPRRGGGVSPTFAFVGVTTGSSAINAIFPRWRDALGLPPDAEIAGVDLSSPARRRGVPPHALAWIRDDPDVLGALVTTHKLDLLRAARDLFDELDPPRRAAAGGLLHRRARRAACSAGRSDPVTASLRARRPRSGRTRGSNVLCMGSGGAGRRDPRSSCSSAGRAGSRSPIAIPSGSRTRRQLHARARIRHRGRVRARRRRRDARPAARRLRPGALVVNATGPRARTGRARRSARGAAWPEAAVAWELNYRGELELLAPGARSPASRAEDGWRYFIFGWTAVMGVLFQRPIGAGDIERLAEAAAFARPRGDDMKHHVGRPRLRAHLAQLDRTTTCRSSTARATSASTRSRSR